MSIIIPTLDYGTVLGRFLVELGDSQDEDLNPDIYPAQGHVIFTPGTSFATVMDADPDPAVIFPQRVIGVLDSEGYLCTASFDALKNEYLTTVDGKYVHTNRGVTLQATDDKSLNPSDWTWRVDFYLTYGGKRIPYDGFNFSLEAGSEVDLTLVKPRVERPGEYTIIGPRGPRGEKGDQGESNVLSIGTVVGLPTGSAPQAEIEGNSPRQTLNLGIPAGPVGPSGGPVPVGGSEGQTIVREDSGGMSWTGILSRSSDNMFPNGSLEFSNTYGFDARYFEYRTLDQPVGFNGAVWMKEERTLVDENSMETFSGYVAVEPGESYIFEMWVKSTKVGSVMSGNIKAQQADVTALSAVENIAGSAASGTKLIDNYTVPTTWTNLSIKCTINADVHAVTLGDFTFNHADGAEQTAQIGVAGLKMTKIIPEKNLSFVSTPNLVPNTVVRRDANGSAQFNSIAVSVTTPTVYNQLTSKLYVDNKVNPVSNGLSSLTTEVNTLKSTVDVNHRDSGWVTCPVRSGFSMQGGRSFEVRRVGNFVMMQWGVNSAGLSANGESIVADIPSSDFMKSAEDGWTYGIYVSNTGATSGGPITIRTSSIAIRTQASLGSYYLAAAGFSWFV